MEYIRVFRAKSYYVQNLRCIDLDEEYAKTLTSFVQERLADGEDFKPLTAADLVNIYYGKSARKGEIHQYKDGSEFELTHLINRWINEDLDEQDPIDEEWDLKYCHDEVEYAE